MVSFLIQHINAILLLIAGLAMIGGAIRIPKKSGESLEASSKLRQNMRVAGFGLMVLGGFFIWKKHNETPNPNVTSQPTTQVWMNFREPGYFSVDLPKPPERSTETSPEPARKWTVSDDRGVYYLIQCVQHPKDFQVPGSDEYIEQLRLASQIQETTITSIAPGQRQHPGAQMTVDAPGQHKMRFEIIATPQRRYQLIATYPPGVPVDKDLFFKSFQILDPTP